MKINEEIFASIKPENGKCPQGWIQLDFRLHGLLDKILSSYSAILNGEKN